MSSQNSTKEVGDLDVLVIHSKSSVVIIEDNQVVFYEQPRIDIISESSTGRPGKDGEPGKDGKDGVDGKDGTIGKDGKSSGTAIFIVDVSASGIVSSKGYIGGTVPPNTVLTSCVTDTSTVRVTFACGGGETSYSPTVKVNDVNATLTETSTKRWFSGYADIPLLTGDNTVTAVSSEGTTAEAIVTLMGAGPAITAISFGPYPGTQTELKQNDVISVTVTTVPSATSVTIYASGASKNSLTLPVTNGTATTTMQISSLSGQQKVTAKARNSFGTYGVDFQSGNLTLNQTYPSFGSFGVSYPSPQGALKGTEQATVTCNVANADLVAYTSPDVTIPLSNTYSSSKVVTNKATGYVVSGTNYTITARRIANDSSATASTLIKVATLTPTASITIPNTTRLISSPTGIDYEIRINPSQELLEPPSLIASIGTWQGSWVLSGSYWKRNLRIFDSDPRSVGVFSSLTLKNLASISGNSITSGQNYQVGGFSQRTVTFPKFSRVADIGVAVLDQTKTSSQLIGGSALTRYNDSAVRTNGYYIANSDGSYNATGSFLALSDTAFAGANTSGTLQASIQESM